MEENPFAPPSANLVSRDSFGPDHGVAPGVISGLARTKGWVRLAGTLLLLLFILQTISVVLMALGMGAMGSSPLLIGAPWVVAGVGEVFAFLLVLWPGLRLLRYSRAIALLVEKRTAAELEEALDAQRGFWKHVGIVTVIYIGVCLIWGVGMGFLVASKAGMGR